MVTINIREETRNKINIQVLKEKQANPYLRITQDYIITKALNKLEESNNE